jgi:dihydroxyacid dehydratase/phosphogluconate dehydratase
MVLPGSSILAADAGHVRLCSESGRRIVGMVWEDLKPTDIQTREALAAGHFGQAQAGVESKPHCAVFMQALSQSPAR